MKTGWIITTLAVAVAFGAGWQLARQQQPEARRTGTATQPAATPRKRKILYWVAPMNPNFRSDKPGKSPMGMDLVPVYADQKKPAAAQGVRIDPRVVENLGVRTAPVQRGDLPRLIETVGYVTFDEDRLSHVHLRTSGWIEKLYFKSEGEPVHRGDVLFDLYSPELVNAQEEYLQAIRMGNAALRRASRERLRALGIGEGEIAHIRKSRQVRQLIPIRARQDGIIDRLKVREGMYVKPKDEVMMLADLSRVWLQVDVFERQSAWVKLGQPAQVRLPYMPGRVWRGKVTFIYPDIDPKTRTLRVRLRFDNQDGLLKPNMYADVRIAAAPRRNVLSIPREALIRTGNAERVIVALGNGRFDARPVVAGIESGDRVEIVRGLRENERVVTSAQFLIDSESSLQASMARMGAGAEDTKPAEETQP